MHYGRPHRLSSEDYSRHRTHLVTIITYRRRRYFRPGPLAAAVFESLLDPATERTIGVLAACLMPDHLHLLVRVTACPLQKWVVSWKRFTTRISRPHGITSPLWANSFHDRCTRRRWGVSRVVQYLAQNPVKAGLVARWREYPYTWIVPELLPQRSPTEASERSELEPTLSDEGPRRPGRPCPDRAMERVRSGRSPRRTPPGTPRPWRACARWPP